MSNQDADVVLVQIGWRSRRTGKMCECPVYERSPHVGSDPVMVPQDAVDIMEKRSKWKA